MTAPVRREHRANTALPAENACADFSTNKHGGANDRLHRDAPAAPHTKMATRTARRRSDASRAPPTPMNGTSAQ
ncbi:hypothetical protein chiPu_0022682 [Chiloscyllium punctatum]|uniref:Uncharacterized protein n=1 Tax=Chiloscyllium punctatum TaxID=137246 RepID=A0A401T8D4_CHIPU|nr:hypothetical protein [Chiloscyllium punctatum]